MLSETFTVDVDIPSVVARLYDAIADILSYDPRIARKWHLYPRVISSLSPAEAVHPKDYLVVDIDAMWIPRGVASPHWSASAISIQFRVLENQRSAIVITCEDADFEAFASDVTAYLSKKWLTGKSGKTARETTNDNSSMALTDGAMALSSEARKGDSGRRTPTLETKLEIVQEYEPQRKQIRQTDFCLDVKEKYGITLEPRTLRSWIKMCLDKGLIKEL